MRTGELLLVAGVALAAWNHLPKLGRVDYSEGGAPIGVGPVLSSIGRDVVSTSYETGGGLVRVPNAPGLLAVSGLALLVYGRVRS